MTGDPDREHDALPRIDILGVGIHALNMQSAVALIEKKLAQRTRGYVCATDVNAVMIAQRDPHFLAILNNSFLTVPDGMPTVWLGRLQGHNEMSRVYGPDLMLAVCEMSVAKGYTHFLYGGTEGVADALRQKLQLRFSGLKIVGTRTPPFRPLHEVEEAALKKEIAALKPDIFWVGLGAPKQERFMAEYLDRLETRLMFGVGAAFDFHSGRKKEAPKWMKDAGMQWVHRLIHEPRRLWKRYLFNNPAFVLLLMREMWSSARRNDR